MSTHTANRSRMADKTLNLALFASFAMTILVPLTGIHIHKLASVIFLLLSIAHTIRYRNRLKGKILLLLALVVLSFFSGLFGMILDQFPMVLVMHRVISIAVVFFMAIHIFIFHRRLC